jgi:hypothetical protein
MLKDVHVYNGNRIQELSVSDSEDISSVKVAGTQIGTIQDYPYAHFISPYVAYFYVALFSS